MAEDESPKSYLADVRNFRRKSPIALLKFLARKTTGNGATWGTLEHTTRY